MSRVVVVLALIVAALWMIDHAARSTRLEERRRYSAVRPLVALGDTAVHAIEVAPPSPHPTWRFEKREHWLYPAYHAVHADEPRIERLLEAVARSTCTLVPPSRRPRPPTGLARDRALRIRLTTGTDQGSVEVWVGHGIPSEGSPEAYARLAAADTVYHLHANPRALLADWGGADPGGEAEQHDQPIWRQVPLLDPGVIPRATAPAPIVVVRFSGAPDSPAQLWQVQVERERRGAPEPPAIEWRIRAGGRDQRCITTQAVAYIQFLTRLSYETAESRAAWQHADRRTVAVELDDAAGTTHRLELGVPHRSGNVYLRNATTGYVYTIAPAKAAALIPAVAALVDSVAGPSLYESLEPRRRLF